MKPLLPFVILLFAAAPALAGPGELARDAELHAEPFRDAEVLTALEAGTALDVGERRGGWYRVEAAGRRGWVRMTRVRLRGDAATGEGDSGVDEALGMLTTGRSGSSGVTVATGIRGLDEAGMVNASPDFAALDRLGRYAVDGRAAERFARTAGLAASEIDYDPAAPEEQGGSGFFGGF